MTINCRDPITLIIIYTYKWVPPQNVYSSVVLKDLIVAKTFANGNFEHKSLHLLFILSGFWSFNYHACLLRALCELPLLELIMMCL